MKNETAYLTYMVHNLDDGHDQEILGVFRDLGKAKQALISSMKDMEEEKLVDQLVGDVSNINIYNDWQNRLYAIETVEVMD